MDCCMLFSGINWWAVLVVTVLSFAMGSLWHSNLMFGKAWKEDAKPVFDPSDKASVIRLFGLSAVYHFVAIVALAVFIGHYGTPLTGLWKGFIISLVFVSSSIGVTYLFQCRSFRLFFIDAGFMWCFILLQG